MVGLDDLMGLFLAQPVIPRTSPGLLSPRCQRDLGTRHPREKGQELHPEREQMSRPRGNVLLPK